MRRAWLAILIVGVSAEPLGAQRLVTADAGIAVLQQTGIQSSAAVTGGLTLDAIGDRAWLRSSALAAIAGSDRATAQGLIFGGLLSPRVGGTRWELNASASGFAESGDSPSLSADLFAGVRFERGLNGTAIGLGTGAVGLRDKWSGILRAQGDAWWRTASDRFAVGVAVVAVPSAPERVLNNGQIAPFVVQNRRSYFDGSLNAHREADGVSLSAAGGLRATIEGAGGGAWGSAEAAMWVGEQAALVASVGQSLEDVERGVPRTRFAGVAVRLAARPRSVAKSREGQASVVVVALDGGRQEIEVRGVEAAQLEVMGDFTDWKPLPLGREGGVWRATLTISSGLHRLALRADGGMWIAPPGLPHADDGLGGTVGLITIP